jgi:hypothetical protein
MNKEISRIQIFGERCSGTNYLEALLANSLPAVPVCWDYGFKHFFPQASLDNSAGCLFIIIYRAPLDWLRSLYRNPWHAAPGLRNIPFPEFIRSEWWCVWDEVAGITRDDPRYGTEMMMERHPETGARFEDVMAMRTAKIRAWESIRDKAVHSFYINYERLRQDPEKIIRGIAGEFDISAVSEFNDVKQYKGGRWYQGWRTRLLRKPLPAISAADRQYVLTRLDAALERQIGYDIYSDRLENRAD